MRGHARALAIVVSTVGVCLACGEDRPATTIRPEATPPSTEAPAPETALPPAPAEPRADLGQTRRTEPTERVTHTDFERAIEPVEGAARAVVTVERGRRRYVLFRYDGAAVARSRIATQPDGAFELDLIRGALDECEDEGEYGAFDCAVRVAPDVYLAASVVCDAHGWGVAVLEQRGGAYVRVARRILFALACNDGAVLDEEPALRLRDPDADGREELIAILPVSLVRSDRGMGGASEGVVAYVLDTELRTQLRVTSHHEVCNRDVAGTCTSCRGGWRFTDANGDGHADVHVNARCTHDWQDDESGDATHRRERDERDCLYDAGSDAWRCDPPIAEWLFGGGATDLTGETPEEVATALRDLGANLPAARAAARAQEDEDEEEAIDPSPASPPRRCTSVVDDPAPPLRVRAEPNARSATLGELANGTELELGERRGRWARIERPTAGWVWTASVRERCEPEPAR